MWNVECGMNGKVRKSIHPECPVLLSFNFSEDVSAGMQRSRWWAEHFSQGRSRVDPITAEYFRTLRFTSSSIPRSARGIRSLCPFSLLACTYGTRDETIARLEKADEQ